MNEKIPVRLLSFTLITISAVMITFALVYAKAALIPFVFALFLHALLYASARYFRFRLHLPQWGAMSLTMILLVVIIALIIFLFGLAMHEFISSLDSYRAKISEFVKALGGIADEFGYILDAAAVASALRDLPVFSYTTSITGNLLGISGNLVLVSIFTIFLFIGGNPAEKRHLLFDDIEGKVVRYVIIKLSVSLLTGSAVWFVYSLLGVELAIMFGVVTTLLNFIPTIGSLFASVLPIPVVLLQFDFTLPFYLAIGWIMLVQITVGNLLEPKLMGDGLELHPVTVLLFLIFWGLVWGIPGMFLAAPITAILKIILQRIESTRVLATLMEGRIPEKLAD